ncbi:transporter substrate-binding domain-containing protein [Clostridium sp. E02]|uniref:transporter substrate-binding domain-containing protein n=1 Tax=Clostridium sp. E02 TaxID=2487134 RepID=UPI0019D26F7B|nr:transporter substrate-binding domain-containing protein [Clostridium sp. E02]
MNFQKKIVIFGTMIAIITALTACGNKSTDALTRVKENGTLTVVGSGGYPPFNYMEEDQVVGFDVDVGKEIAKRLGVKLDYVTSDWDGLVEGLRNKRYDAILGSMAITDKRSEVVDFTDPYYYSGAQLFVRKDSNITKADEMADKKIAVATGTNFVQDAEALNADVSYYQDDNATLLELINGRVDGVITDRLVALSAMKKLSGGDDLMMADHLLRLEKMGIAFNKDDQTLLNRINEILKEMREDGTLKEISVKWLDGVDITVE